MSRVANVTGRPDRSQGTSQGVADVPLALPAGAGRRGIAVRGLAGGGATGSDAAITAAQRHHGR